MTKIRGSTQIQPNTVTSGQVDTSIIIAAGTNAFTGNQSFGSNRATNLANAVNPNDAITLAQAQALLEGLSALVSVQAVTNGSETYTIVGGSVTQITGTTVGGVTLNVGDRILVMNAAAASGAGTANASNAGSNEPANGIYTVTGNTTNLTVTRDSTSATPLSGTINPAGKFVYVDGGGGYFVLSPLSPDGTFSYGSTNMQWGVFNSGGGSVTTVSVVPANGITGTVANPSTTPAITLGTSLSGMLKGNGSAFQAATAGTDYLAPSSLVTGIPTGSINSTNTSFTVPSTPNSGSLMLFQNGVMLLPGTDFTLSGTTITIATAPLTNDTLYYHYWT